MLLNGGNDAFVGTSSHVEIHHRGSVAKDLIFPIEDGCHSFGRRLLSEPCPQLEGWRMVVRLKNAEPRFDGSICATHLTKNAEDTFISPSRNNNLQHSASRLGLLLIKPDEEDRFDGFLVLRFRDHRGLEALTRMLQGMF